MRMAYRRRTSCRFAGHVETPGPKRHGRKREFGRRIHPPAGLGVGNTAQSAEVQCQSAHHTLSVAHDEKLLSVQIVDIYIVI